MKKLKLNSVNFAGAEVLSRAQLKKVMGGFGGSGSGSGSATATVTCSGDCSCKDGSTKTASVSGCVEGTCDSDSLGVTCKFPDGATAGMSCLTACG